jgi:regulatory protein
MEELALHYVSRFATTRAKLLTYLRRKLRERGWADGEQPVDLEQLADRLAALRYVNDEAFAVAKAGSLSRRGYGPARVSQALRQAGVGEDEGAAGRDLAARDAVEAALRFARRRRLGPWASAGLDPAARQKALASMIRAGHSFGLARAIVAAPPGTDLCPDSLGEYLIIKEP